MGPAFGIRLLLAASVLAAAPAFAQERQWTTSGPFATSPNAELRLRIDEVTKERDEIWIVPPLVLTAASIAAVVGGTALIIAGIQTTTALPGGGGFGRNPQPNRCDACIPVGSGLFLAGAIGIPVGGIWSIVAAVRRHSRSNQIEALEVDLAAAPPVRTAGPEVAVPAQLKVESF